MELVLEERATKRSLDLALACSGLLPTVEPNDSHDVIDVVDDALDDDRRLLVLD
jgi:hypothetical protein